MPDQLAVPEIEIMQAQTKMALLVIGHWSLVTCTTTDS
jgi:hypothetical protein